jgi:hypothetical protein
MLASKAHAPGSLEGQQDDKSQRDSSRDCLSSNGCRPGLGKSEFRRPRSRDRHDLLGCRRSRVVEKHILGCRPCSPDRSDIHNLVVHPSATSHPIRCVPTEAASSACSPAHMAETTGSTATSCRVGVAGRSTRRSWPESWVSLLPTRDRFLSRTRRRRSVSWAPRSATSSRPQVRRPQTSRSSLALIMSLCAELENLCERTETGTADLPHANSAFRAVAGKECPVTNKSARWVGPDLGGPVWLSTRWALGMPGRPAVMGFLSWSCH